MRNGLPTGWITAPLANLLSTLEAGARPRGGVRGIQKGVPSIGGEHLKYDGTFDFSSIKYVPREFAAGMARGRIQANDILVVKDGATTGKTAFVDSTFPYRNAIVNEHVFICRPAPQIEPRYLFRFLMSREGQKRILENFKGSAQGGINQAFAGNTEIPLAPLPEQRRIVAKLDELLAKADASGQRLARIPLLLKRFRQAILAAACSGRLTADWREENGSTGDEWPIVVLGEIADLRLGKMLDKVKNIGEPTRYLRNINVRWFEFGLSDIALLRATKEERKELSIKKGDLLICEGGEPGRCAVWNTDDADMVFQKAVHRVRLAENVSPYWVALNIRNDAYSGRLDEYFTGTTIKHLTGKSLARYEFSLPTLAEQREIVRRVEALFALAHQIEARCVRAKAHADNLAQSILAKAFRGELTPAGAEPTHAVQERE